MELSTMIVRRLEEASALSAFATSHADTLTHALSELDGRAGFQGAQLRALILSQSSWLEELTQRMQAAERSYVEEQDDDIALRGKMGEVSIQLDRKLRLTREHILAAEGPNALQIYGLEKMPPRARDTLVAYARNTIDLLSAHPYTFQTELGEVLETRTIAVMLNDLLLPFQALVQRMNNEVDELQAVLLKRNDAIDAWVEGYCGLARTLEGLARMAGLYAIVEQCIIMLGSYGRLRAESSPRPGGSEEE